MSGVRLAVPVSKKPEARTVEICTCDRKTGKYKMKTKKAAAKRYKITGSGKLLRRQPGKQHLNEKLGPSQKKKLSRVLNVDGADYPVALRCMPYLKSSAFRKPFPKPSDDSGVSYGRKHYLKFKNKKAE